LREVIDHLGPKIKCDVQGGDSNPREARANFCTRYCHAAGQAKRHEREIVRAGAQLATQSGPLPDTAFHLLQQAAVAQHLELLANLGLDVVIAGVELR
jgi:hypothetical protein